MPSALSRRRIVLLVLVAVFALYILLPVAFGIFAVLPVRAPVGPPPDGFEEVTISTGDGIALQAWYAPPENGAVIILIHGAGSSREEVRSQALMLVRHGYGVLAPDLRGHGGSGGASNRFGWLGTRDVGAAVGFLEAQNGITAIGGMGLSLGGEVLLGAASEYPQVRSIVADGATQRSAAELHAMESERPLVRSFVPQLVYAFVQAFSGTAPPKPILDSMVEATSTEFLLVAGGNMPREIAFGELFEETVGGRAELWVVPDAGHTEAFGRYPGEYEQRVITFFDVNLREKAGEGTIAGNPVGTGIAKIT